MLPSDIQPATGLVAANWCSPETSPALTRVPLPGINRCSRGEGRGEGGPTFLPTSADTGTPPECARPRAQQRPHRREGSDPMWRARAWFLWSAASSRRFAQATCRRRQPERAPFFAELLDAALSCRQGGTAEKAVTSHRTPKQGHPPISIIPRRDPWNIPGHPPTQPFCARGRAHSAAIGAWNLDLLWISVFGIWLL